MKRKICVSSCWTWLLLALLVVPLSSRADDTHLPNIIVDVKGHVMIKRQRWSTAVPASYGMIINRGDELRVSTGSELTLICGDISRKVVRRRGPIPCRIKGEQYSAGPLLPARTVSPDGTLRILTPRATSILTLNPSIRWTPVAGAKGYKITIWNSEELSDEPWSTIVDRATESYTIKAPQLKPGRDYFLQVSAYIHNPNEDRFLDQTNFSTLEHKKREAIKNTEMKIKNLNMAKYQKAVVFSALYIKNSLYSEAIGVIEEAYREAHSSVDVKISTARLLGQAYMSVGLFDSAEKYTSEAHELSQKATNIEEQVITKENLSSIYSMLGDHQASERWLHEALKMYQILGDSEKQHMLQDMLDSNFNKINFNPKGSEK
jgi:hypothetical protein